MEKKLKIKENKFNKERKKEKIAGRNINNLRYANAPPLW